MKRHKSIFLLFVVLVLLCEVNTPFLYESVPYYSNLKYALISLCYIGLIVTTNAPAPYVGSSALKFIFLLWVFYVSVSFLWSELLLRSLMGSMGLVLSTFTAFRIVRFFPTDYFLWIVFRSLFLFLVFGVLIIFLFPEIGIENSFFHIGKWRGLSGQKNVFGSVSVYVASMAFAGIIDSNLFGRLAKKNTLYFALILACMCCYMAGTRGALFVLGLLLFLIFFGTKLRSIHVSILGGLFALISIFLFGYIGLELTNDGLILGETSIDSNSRFKIWSYGLEHFMDRPFLGFGLGGFWNQERTDVFASTHSWVLTNFHNGYVTVLIELGAVGLLIVATLVITLILWVAKNWSNLLYTQKVVFIVFVVGFLVYNNFENFLVRTTDLRLFLFSTAVVIFSNLSSRAAFPLSK